MNLLKSLGSTAALVLSLSAIAYAANSISIETPLPGTVVKAGTVCNVTWSWEGTITAVDIDLSADNGTNWHPLALYYDNKGSFTCFIPYFTAPQCKLRVSDVDGSAEDISGTFSMVAGTLSVSVPKIDSASYPVFHGEELTVPVWLRNTGEALLLLNAYATQLVNPPYGDWFAISPELPAFIRPGDSLQCSLTLNKDGIIDGDASLSGLVRLIFNSGSEHKDISIATRVRAFNLEPFFNSPPLNSEVDEGELLTSHVSAFDPDGQPLTLWAENVPDGAWFTDNGDGDGVLSWQTNYTDSGFYKVTYFVTDGLDSSSIDCYIRVGNTNRAPVLTSVGHKYVKALNTLSFNITATDADGDNLSFGVFDPPSNYLFSSGDGAALFTFHPTESQVGDYIVSFWVSDGQATRSEMVMLTVDPIGPMAITACEACAPGTPFGDILTNDPIIVVFSHAIKEISLLEHTSITSRRDGLLKYTYDPDQRALKVTPKSEDLSGLDTISISITAGLTSWTNEILGTSYNAKVTTGPIVYPGDLDNNGIVDERDILPIGAFFGKTGPLRLRYDADDHPRPEPAHRWATIAAGYADANGSGKVDVDDICLVTQYFGWRLDGAAPGDRQPLDLATASADDLRLGELRAALSGCPPSYGQQMLLQALGINNTVVEEALPKTTELFANYPNPFNPSTTISFQLASPARVRLTIFNLMGQTVRTLIDEAREAGEGSIEWNGCDQSGRSVASGVYLYRLEAGNVSQTRQLLLLK